MKWTWKTLLAGIGFLTLASVYSLYFPRDSRETTIVEQECKSRVVAKKGQRVPFAISPRCIVENLDSVKIVKTDGGLENKMNDTKNYDNKLQYVYSTQKRNITKEQMIDLSKKYNVPSALVDAMIIVESDYNPEAISDMGAVGLMQLTVETGRKYGLNIPNYKTTRTTNKSGKEKIIPVCNKDTPNECKFEEDERFDPKKNLEAGISHVSDLLKKHHGNLYLVLAEYHAGNSALERGKVWRYNCYKDTRDYIKNVMSYL